MRQWANELGLDWDRDVMGTVTMSRTTRWRFETGIGGKPSIDAVREYLFNQEHKRATSTSIGLRIGKLDSWETLALWLLQNDAQGFDVLLLSLYDVWSARIESREPISLQGNMLKIMMGGPPPKIPIPDRFRMPDGSSIPNPKKPPK